MKVRPVYVAYIGVFVVLSGVVGGLGGVARSGNAAPWVSVGLTVLLFLLIVGGGLGINLLRRHIERRERTAAPDSFERQAAVQAQAKVFIDLLMLTLLAAVLSLVFPTHTNPAWALFGLVVVAVTDFWVRYARMTGAAAKASL
jgi:uncharacterized membrane-anchored protein